ncbi:unnamed protein product, partial [Arabidopsis halleri]
PPKRARLASCPSGADVVLEACSRHVNSAVARNRTQVAVPPAGGPLPLGDNSW